jgi:hypothetical protein
VKVCQVSQRVTIFRVGAAVRKLNTTPGGTPSNKNLLATGIVPYCPTGKINPIVLPTIALNSRLRGNIAANRCLLTKTSKKLETAVPKSKKGSEVKTKLRKKVTAIEI